ncbi:UNVERIFIED_CONTAM: hypothetical protein FKN15_032430 [Acipenser sinensis]
MALNSDKLLQCGACFCSITSPKLLSCLHSFCQTCLNDQDGCQVVTCPTCHQPTKKAEVKDNKLLSDLQSKLDILRQIARGSDLSCSCSNASARSMCFECEKFLCQKCFEGHQMFLAKENHSMESLESLKVMSSQEFLATARKKRVPYCPDHDKQMISQDKTFDVSILPPQQIEGGVSVVQTHTEALTACLAFLHTLVQPTILVGHNIWKMKCPILCRHLDELGLKDELQELVSGFLDTESLARDNLKGKDIKKFSQQDLSKMLLKKTYPAHNILEAVRNLQELYQSLCPAQEKHLFSLVQLEAHMSLQPLVLAMAVTKPSAQTLAQQGISFETLKQAYQKDPKKGLKHLLRHLGNELGPNKLSKTIRHTQNFFLTKLAH